MSKSFKVDLANIEWLDGEVPYSSDFQDSYFSRAGGLAESQYVYIEQNNILTRCRSKDRLKVAEIGFGTGLNFLLTWKAWREAENRSCQLDYVAFEKFPLCKEDLTRALAPWPELADLSFQLLRCYPVMIPGFVRVPLEQGKINLTLAIGDALDSLAELDSSYDVWYLDGFAPQKNPSLWGENLCAHVQRLSQKGTTVSTFTAAGSVRRLLEKSGFEVGKFAGFGTKRESLKGVLQEVSNAQTLLPPWKALPQHREAATKEAIVIGGGLAGFGVAHALCKRDFKVTILDAAHEGFGGASGNLAGIFSPYIARSPSFTTDLLLPSFLFSLASLTELEEHLGVEIIKRCGAIQLLHTERLKQLYDSLPQLGFHSDIVERGTWQDASVLIHTLAGVIQPRVLCDCISNRWRDHLMVKNGIQVNSLTDLSPGWKIETQNGPEYRAQTVVVCSAQHSSQFVQTNWIPLEAVRGELVYTNTTEESRKLSTVLMGKGYILPPQNDLHVVGADYAHNNSDLTPNAVVHSRLMNQAKEILPALRDSLVVESRASFRTSTHHRLPYVGPVVKFDSYQNQFSDLQKGYPPSHYEIPEYYRGLYISAGHGSRGLVSTLSAGEYLADIVTGTTPLFKNSLCGELNPASYLAKRLTQKL